MMDLVPVLQHALTRLGLGPYPYTNSKAQKIGN